GRQECPPNPVPRNSLRIDEASDQQGSVGSKSCGHHRGAGQPPRRFAARHEVVFRTFCRTSAKINSQNESNREVANDGRPVEEREGHWPNLIAPLLSGKQEATRLHVKRKLQRRGAGRDKCENRHGSHSGSGMWPRRLNVVLKSIFQRELDVTRSLRGEDLAVVRRARRVLAAELLTKVEDRGVGKIRHVHPELERLPFGYREQFRYAQVR